MDGAVAERDADCHTDEYAWLLQQAAALRARRLTALDTENLAEFLEAMARSEVREVASRLRVLLAHMLKFLVQPERAGRSWALTVYREQNSIADIVEQATLRRVAEQLLSREWERARIAAAKETGLPLEAFPTDNPWTLEEALAWNPPGDASAARPRPRRR